MKILLHNVRFYEKNSVIQQKNSFFFHQQCPTNILSIYMFSIPMHIFYIATTINNRIAFKYDSILIKNELCLIVDTYFYFVI